jgi:hypothetical protein
VSYDPYAVNDAMPRRRRGGCLRTAVIAVVALLVLLVAADFVGRAVAENVAASQIQRGGFPKKPSVSIEGFPFLTQVASHNFQQIRLSSSDIPEGPVVISKVNAVADNIHLNGNFKSGTIGSVSGTILITFGSLATALDNALGPAGQLVGSSGLTLSAAGPEEIKASLNLVVTSGSATFRVTRLSGQRLNVTLVSSSGVPASLLGPVRNFSFNIPKLPFGLVVQNVSVTPAGIVGQISATNVPFSQ